MCKKLVMIIKSIVISGYAFLSPASSCSESETKKTIPCKEGLT